MKRFAQLALPYIVWAALMLVLPMALIALYSFMEQGNSIIPFSFTLNNYIRFFTDPDFLLILWRSILIALKTTVICLLLGYPIAYFIARSSGTASEHSDSLHHDSHVDQYAGAHLCLDRSSE